MNLRVFFNKFKYTVVYWLLRTFNLHRVLTILLLNRLTVTLCLTLKLVRPNCWLYFHVVTITMYTLLSPCHMLEIV